MDSSFICVHCCNLLYGHYSWDFVYLLNSFNFGWGNDPSAFFTNHVGGSSNLASSTTLIFPTLICTLILWAFFWVVSTLYEIFIAFGVFSILGHVSLTSSVPMNELISEGTGLLFIVFPQIFNTMGVMGHVIAPLLFISILFAGFTSSLALFEPLLSSLCEKFGWSRKKGVTTLTIVACVGTVIFSTGISSYLVEIVDGFVNNFGIMIMIVIQAIIFGWFYGVEKVMPVLNELSTFKVGKTWAFTIKYLLPILLIIIWAFGVLKLINDENSFKIAVSIIIMIIVVGLSVVLTKLNPLKNRD